MKASFSYLLITSITVIIAISFRPISLKKENNVQLTGRVSITEFDSLNHDVSIHLEGDTRSFYINRAIEKGLYPKGLASLLHNKTIQLYVSDQWSILDPFKKHRHITQLSIGDSLVFNELRQ